jgi:hypothetical protein
MGEFSERTKQSLRDSAARARETHTMTERWQPIEIAPKDGTRILAVCELDDDRPEIVEWVEWKPGWWNGDYTYDPDDFTHWTRLPLPTDGEVEDLGERK